VRIVEMPVHKVEGPKIGGNAALVTKDSSKVDTIRLRYLIYGSFINGNFAMRCKKLYTNTRRNNAHFC
jgi:hypothetical protein